jgi:hypothetical protein
MKEILFVSIWEANMPRICFDKVAIVGNLWSFVCHHVKAQLQLFPSTKYRQVYNSLPTRSLKVSTIIFVVQNIFSFPILELDASSSLVITSINNFINLHKKRQQQLLVILKAKPNHSCFWKSTHNWILVDKLLI